ncbi:MAG: DUF1285 domain-containing protein [Reinekea sp.]
MTSKLNDAYVIQEPSPSEKALITSALTLYSIHQEKNISVTQLVKAAGISKSVFYRYFANIDDVYAAILLTDELQLTPILKELRAYGTISDLLKHYLRFRIRHIEKYRLLIRIEQYLSDKNCDVPRYAQWNNLRRQHMDEFMSIVESKLSRTKVMDREQLKFYYGLVWAMASGVANLYENDFFLESIQDRRGFTQFLDSILQQISDTNNSPVHLWHPEHIAEIDICIKRNGEWLHQGRVIERKGLVKLFAGILRNDDGEFYLVTPVEKCHVDVESTPLVVILAERIEDRWFITNNLDETIELIDQKIEWLDEQTPALVWRDQLPARLSQSVLYQLQVYALDHGGMEGDQLWLQTGDSRVLLTEE